MPSQPDKFWESPTVDGSAEGAALMGAIELGEEDKALALLAAGAPANAGRGRGDTALALAKSPALVRALIEAGGGHGLDVEDGGAMAAAALSALGLYMSGARSQVGIEKLRRDAVSKICLLHEAGASWSRVEPSMGISAWRAISIQRELAEEVLAALAKAEREEIAAGVASREGRSGQARL